MMNVGRYDLEYMDAIGYTPQKTTPVDDFPVAQADSTQKKTQLQGVG